MSVVGVIINLLLGAVLLFGSLDSEADYLTGLIDEDSNLIAKLISHQFSAFDADMLLTVELHRDVVRGETDWTAI